VITTNFHKKVLYKKILLPSNKRHISYEILLLLFDIFIFVSKYAFSKSYIIACDLQGLKKKQNLAKQNVSPMKNYFRSFTKKRG